MDIQRGENGTLQTLAVIPRLHFSNSQMDITPRQSGMPNPNTRDYIFESRTLHNFSGARCD